MKTESQRIGQYELRQPLRQDQVCETWHAYDTVEQRSVILKFYHTDIPSTSASLNHYLHNAEQIAALHHPNIVRIYDIQILPHQNTGVPSSLTCLVLESIEGGTLAEYLRNTSSIGKIPPPAEIVQIFSALALALDSARQRGVIHGNLKPTNILFNQNAASANRIGAPMLTDFSATRMVSKKHGNDIPFYLPPEQIQGAPADGRSDIYSLGVLLYELYTGMPPFRGNRPIAVMMQHVNAQPTPPHLVNPTISPALTQIILRCLAKDPNERFPSATSLAITLAHALHVPIPENLRRFALTLGSEARESQSAQQFSSTTNQQAIIDITPQQASVAKPTPTRKSGKRPLLMLCVLALVAILGASFVTWLLVVRGNTSGTAQIVGHAFFLNSGQLNANTTQGINDELQIQLSSLPDPAAGKSYYAWLLGDINKTEQLPLLLGRLTVEHGTVHFLYPGDSRHDNLLAFASRFLITEDNTQNPTSNPLLDQSTWRYYTIIPQTPDPGDALHFSQLDHLRHLLVESPELSIRHLHGGLAFWFARDTATVADLTRDLANDWQKADANTIHAQVVRILDYLDSSAFIQPDVPAGTPFLADPQTSQVPLLGPAPKDSDPPGYVFQNEPPPGYVYLVQSHLNGAVLSPQTTPAQHQLALQINGDINPLIQALTSVYQDAKRLVQMTNTQLLQASALTIIDNLATQAQEVYTGQVNPSTGTSQGGALWIYDNLQRLATFEVSAYIAPKS